MNKNLKVKLVQGDHVLASNDKVEKATENTILSEYFELLKNEKMKSVKELFQFFQLKKILRCFETKKTYISENVDKILFPNGLINGELYTITAISGGGKTAFCCMLASCLIYYRNPHLVKEKHPTRSVIYVTLEQTSEQIMCRILSTLSALNDLNSAIPYCELVSGNNYNDDDLRTACEVWNECAKKLEIISQKDVSTDIQDILTACFEAIQTFDDHPVVILDQYVNIDSTSSPVDDSVVKSIKAFAEINHVPIILVTQCSKEAINGATDKDGSIRSEKITGRSLRGTSGLEHQSTAILTLTAGTQKKDVCNQLAYVVNLRFVKNRYGNLAETKLLYLPAFNLFLDFTENRGRPAKV